VDIWSRFLPGAVLSNFASVLCIVVAQVQASTAVGGRAPCEIHYRELVARRQGDSGPEKVPVQNLHGPRIRNPILKDLFDLKPEFDFVLAWGQSDTGNIAD
jgi:hypothetical protein